VSGAGTKSITNEYGFRMLDNSQATNKYGIVIDNAAYTNTLGGLNIASNAITSTSNGNISITPNGTGDIILDGQKWPQADGTANQVLKTDGAGQLSWTSAGAGAVGITVVGDDSTGTLISDGETIKIAGGTGITTAVSGDTITITATGGGGSTGDLSIIGSTISSPSNGDLTLTTNGTGKVIAGDDFTAANLDNYTNASNSFPAFGDIATIKSNLLFTSNLAVPNITTFAERNFNNAIYSYGKADSSGTTYNDTDFRWGNVALSLFDMAGATANSTVTGNRGAAIRGMAISTGYKNSGGGTKTTPNQVGVAAFNEIQEGHGGDLTVVNQIGMRAGNSVRANTGEFSRITNAIGFIADTISAGGTGANNTNRFVTNEYGFYDAPTTSSSLITNHYGYYVHTGSAATNKYAFYSADDTYLSRLGTIERYLEKINTLTSSSTITVDTDLAPVHTVTLGINTDFFLTNLSTGQSVRLIIKQDATGSRTATFSTATSTAVKFPGGTPTLSTAANSIDVVTIFNDGTNYLGTIIKAYA
jgi:hypothetical protein